MEKFRIGAVKFLNALPLIYKLDEHPVVELCTDVPSRLAEALNGGRVDAALAPAIDYQRSERPWRILPSAVIGSLDEVLTVRVFSRIPPEAITTIAGDTDSHTSVVLAEIIWRERYRQTVEIKPLPDEFAGENTVLLIGDKVLGQCGGWPYELDLGRIWREMTSLPFVYAFWAVREEMPVERCRRLHQILRESYQNGMGHLKDLSREHGRFHGFSPEQAYTYFTRNISYEFTMEAFEGLKTFYKLAHEKQLIERLKPLDLFSE